MHEQRVGVVGVPIIRIHEEVARGMAEVHPDGRQQVADERGDGEHAEDHDEEHIDPALAETKILHPAIVAHNRVHRKLRRAVGAAG